MRLTRWRPSLMSRVRFRAGEIELELAGSEAFVLRQLELLSVYLEGVDAGALRAAPNGGSAVREPTGVEEPVPPASEPEPAPPAVEPVAQAAVPEPPAAPTNGGQAVAPPRPGNGGADAADDLIRFYGRFQPQGLDRQSDAALLFAYYLQQREGLPSLQLGDLIRCCIRAGVDTRNFNRTLGILTRRGYLETVRHGHAYRLSEHGVAAVESRM